MAVDDIQVRRAGMADLDALAPLFDGYRRFYGQDADLDAARDFLEARLQREQSVVLIALDTSGSAMGFTQLYPLFSSVRMVRIWLLNDLYVAADHRRRGVADALMAEAESWASADGAAAIVLETTEENRQAQALYERRGWELEQGMRHYHKTLEPA